MIPFDICSCKNIEHKSFMVIYHNIFNNFTLSLSTVMNFTENVWIFLWFFMQLGHKLWGIITGSSCFPQTSHDLQHVGKNARRQLIAARRKSDTLSGAQPNMLNIKGWGNIWAAWFNPGVWRRTSYDIELNYRWERRLESLEIKQKYLERSKV